MTPIFINCALEEFKIKFPFTKKSLRKTYKKKLKKLNTELVEGKKDKRKNIKQRRKTLTTYYNQLLPYATDEIVDFPPYNTSKPYEKWFDYSVEDKLDLLFQKKVTLKSSHIKWASYHKKGRILAIRFKDSPRFYAYTKVKKSKYKKLIKSKSHGRYLRLKIKPNHFFYRINGKKVWKEVCREEIKKRYD